MHLLQWLRTGTGVSRAGIGSGLTRPAQLGLSLSSPQSQSRRLRRRPLDVSHRHLGEVITDFMPLCEKHLPCTYTSSEGSCANSLSYCAATNIGRCPLPRRRPQEKYGCLESRQKQPHRQQVLRVRQRLWTLRKVHDVRSLRMRLTDTLKPAHLHVAANRADHVRLVARADPILPGDHDKSTEQLTRPKCLLSVLLC